MKRRMKSVFSLLLVVVLLFTGCASSSTPSSSEKNPSESSGETDKKEIIVLNVNLDSDVKTLDPSLNNAIVGSHVLNNTFEGLMREVDGNLGYGTAETVNKSDDGTIYTFTIREGAKWSDGKAVTAQDFEYSWKRVLNPETAATYATHMFYIKNAKKYYEGNANIEDVGIKSLDENTFEVTLESPTPYFLSLITRPSFMPLRKDIIESVNEDWSFDPEAAISNGPFVLKSYTAGDRLVLTKNANYWNSDNVNIDQINCFMIVEESTALTAFESGDLDIISNIPKQEMTRLMTESPMFHILPLMGTYYLEFNVNKKPFDDVRVRKALSLAIDRKLITENVTKGGEVPATGFNPLGMKDSQENDFNIKAGDYGINIYGGNFEEAKKLLSDAGYPNGEGFPIIDFLYNTSESNKAICEALQEMWKKELGVKVNLTNQEWGVFMSNKKEGNFNLSRAGYVVDYPDPVGLLELMVEGQPNNNAHWVNDEFNNLIAESRFKEGKERDEIIYRAEKILMDEAPISPIYYYTSPVMVNEKVTGWQKDSMGYWYFGKVNISE